MKGQFSIVNLIGTFLAFILYFMMLPILLEISNSTVSDIQTDCSIDPALPMCPYVNLLIPLIFIIGPAIILILIVNAFNYAIPRLEGRY